MNDISKTMHELGYVPQYDYHSLLLDYKKYMENEPLLYYGEKVVIM